MKRSPINKRNPKRRASEFARCYGSDARALAIAERACDSCGRPASWLVPNQNAHTEGGGVGRKAGWETVVTLCPLCHLRLHHLGSVELFDAEKGTDLKATARRLAVEIPA